jgi:uncharacterized protein (DUF4415 family)
MHNKTRAKKAPAVNDIDDLGLALDALPFQPMDIEFQDIDVDVQDLDLPKADLDGLELELPGIDLDAALSTRAPTAPVASLPVAMPSGTGRSVRTTIRLPRSVVEEFKRRAVTDGAGYQTLIVRALREWLAAPRPPKA